jgi:thiol:disulfide interchange protein DsbD
MRGNPYNRGMSGRFSFVPWLAVLLAFVWVSGVAAQLQPPARVQLQGKLNVEALVPGKPAVLAVIVDVPAGFHAQSNRPLDDLLIPTTLAMEAAEGVHFGPPQYPPGKVTELPVLGKVSEYVGRVVIYVPMEVMPDARPGPITVQGTLTVQICDERGTCYPPTDEPLSVVTTIAPVGSTPVPANESLFADYRAEPLATQPGGASTTESPPVDAVASLFGYSLKIDSLGLAVFVGFLAGIIFNVMPCVLPVLPLKAVGFYEAAEHSRSRTILFGLMFTLGMVALFTLLGLFVLLSKQLIGRDFNWGQQFSYPWFVWAIAVILAGLGFALLSGWSLSLPTSFYGLNFRHDTLSGNVLWGAFTAVLSTPCTAPLFPPLLAWAVGQPTLNGLLAVMSVGVGMASPYLVLSAFPELARRFPRSGPFAELVKQMMGFLLLASAAFFAGMQLLPSPNHWWLVFAVVSWGSLFLIVRTVQITKSSGALLVSTAVAVLAIGLTLLLVLRATDALSSVTSSNGATAKLWSSYSREALDAARKDGRIVLVKFTADWCLNCQYIEQTVFKDARALDALQAANVVLLKADLTKRDALGWPLLEQLGARGIPFTAIYQPGRDDPLRLASMYTTTDLLAALGNPTN